MVNDVQSALDDFVGPLKVSRATGRSGNRVMCARWRCVNEVKMPPGKRAGIKPAHDVAAYRGVGFGVHVQRDDFPPQFFKGQADGFCSAEQFKAPWHFYD